MEEKFTDINEIKTKIINLSATLNLPKGTEAFISDVHGNYDKYLNIIRSGAGNISRKVGELFNGRLTVPNQQKLVCLIYYPEDILKKITPDLKGNDLEQWYMDTTNQMIEVLRYVAEKYPQNVIDQSLDTQFLDISEELVFGDLRAEDKRQYYREMVKQLVELGLADEFIISLCHAIQKLAIERIHIVGDLYDRGPHPDKVIDHLTETWQNFDFEWGNHDVLWLGSMAGSKLCMMNLIRISARYHNLKLLEDVYGIDLTSMVKFATNRYMPLPNFEPKVAWAGMTDEEKDIDNCIQQAAAIIQFKLEGQAIKRRPEFEMDDRLLLDKLSLDKRTITINGKDYPIENGCFQTVNPASPYQITNSERVVLIDLINQFIQSNKLNEDMWFLADNGGMYLEHNDNLLFHGCIPVDQKGNLSSIAIEGKAYAGKELLDYSEYIVKDAMRHPTTADCFNSDFIWYLWEGKKSPLFGKDKMTTFERYFVNDKEVQRETPNPFFDLCNEEWFANRILREFELSTRGHIVNGHTPADENANPVMADKKIIVVNGMFDAKRSSKIGGHTLLYDSYGMRLETLKPFANKNKSIAEMSDVVMDKEIVEHSSERRTIKDTDYGKSIQKQIKYLRKFIK